MYQATSCRWPCHISPVPLILPKSVASDLHWWMENCVPLGLLHHTQHTHLIFKCQGCLLLNRHHLLPFPHMLWIQGAMLAGVLQVCEHHTVLLAAGSCLQSIMQPQWQAFSKQPQVQTSRARPRAEHGQQCKPDFTVTQRRCALQMAHAASRRQSNGCDRLQQQAACSTESRWAVILAAATWTAQSCVWLSMETWSRPGAGYVCC